MELIDSHAHLYLDDFDADLEKVIERCREKSINKVLLPNIDTSTTDSMLKICEEHPRFFQPMMGLHPCSVKKDYKVELNKIEKHFSRRKFIAVGEIGLDYHWDTTFKKQQKDAFKTQINWAKELGLPVVIHCRKSFDDIANTVEQLHDENLRGVLHCFSGTVEQAARITDLGFYLGIGGRVTFKNAGLDKVVKQLNLKNLILETDSPYLTPAPFRGKRNESSFLSFVAEKVANLHRQTVEEIAKITTENTIELFKGTSVNSTVIFQSKK